MIQSLPYDENKFNKNAELEDILNAEDDSDFGYILEVDINYHDKIKEKSKHFPFCPENEVSPQDMPSEYMNKTKSETFTPCIKN